MYSPISSLFLIYPNVNFQLEFQDVEYMINIVNLTLSQNPWQWNF